ncbi:hypothetical protein ACOMHN_039482 [Nucella lapillus]
MSTDMKFRKLCLMTTLMGVAILKVNTSPASSWHVREHHQHNINSFLDVMSARSKLDCVQICSRLSQCMACAFKYNPGTTAAAEGMSGQMARGTCYLMPSINSGSVGVNSPVTVLNRESQDTLCDESKSLAIPNGRVTSWQRSLTSVEGSVTCDADYIYVGSNPTVKCFVSNKWQPPNGTCAQRVWRSDKVQTYMNVPIPKPVDKGWSLCLNATPDQMTRVSVNLLTDKYRAVLHLDFRLNYLGYLNAIVMDANYSGFWGWKTELDSPNPFPLSQGVRFSLIITVLDDSNVQITVYGEEGSWVKPARTLPGRAQEVTQVTVTGDYSLDVLDLWCLDTKT